MRVGLRCIFKDVFRLEVARNRKTSIVNITMHNINDRSFYITQMDSNIFIYILTYDKFYRKFVIFQFKKKRGDVKIKYIKAYLEDNGEKYKSTLKQLFTKLNVSDFERIRVKVISSTFITFSKRNELRNKILKKSMRHKSDSYSKFLAEKRCKEDYDRFLDFKLKQFDLKVKKLKRSQCKEMRDIHIDHERELEKLKRDYREKRDRISRMHAQQLESLVSNRPSKRRHSGSEEFKSKKSRFSRGPCHRHRQNSSSNNRDRRDPSSRQHKRSRSPSHSSHKRRR